MLTFFQSKIFFLEPTICTTQGNKSITNAYNYNYETNLDESALWLGAGYQSSGPVRFQAGVMYNVLYKENESIFLSGFQPFMGVSYRFIIKKKSISVIEMDFCLLY